MDNQAAAPPSTFSRKKVFSFIIVVGLLAAVPLAILLTQQRTQTQSGAANFAGYDLSCAENPSAAILSVQDPQEFYCFDETNCPLASEGRVPGDYTLKWKVTNISDQPQTIHAELFSCRCSAPNAQVTPEGLLEDPLSAYPGRICSGSWPGVEPADPNNPTVQEVEELWNYCDYAYGASEDRLSGDNTSRKQKIDRAAATTQIQNPALTLQPGESQDMEWTVSTPGTDVTFCGSFQIDWHILAVDNCTIIGQQGLIDDIAGVLITGDGAGEYESWRPDGVSAIGDVCEQRTTSQFKACVNEACVPQAGLTADQCTSDSECKKTTESICNANDQCIQVAPEDLKPGDVTCTSTTDCESKPVCVNNSCELKRGATAAECAIGANDPVTGNNPNCVETYLMCEDLQCVRKEGKKDDQCTTVNDCSHLACDTDTKTCERVAGEGVDTCKSDPDCQPGGGPKHNVCNETTFICEEVDGFGQNECTDNRHCQPTTHNECNTTTKVCEEVDGPGMDQCYNNADCEDPQHLVCDTATEACILVDGPGQDRCENDLDCIEPEHLECVQDSCELVEGFGQDLCLNDSDCIDTHLACNTVTETCEEVTGLGADECLFDEDCVPEITTHLVCNTNTETCEEVTGIGANECLDDLDCRNIVNETHLVCINEACVDVTGSGTDECTFDSDCRNITNTSHRICSNDACVRVQGDGIDECSVDQDCQTTPPSYNPPVGTPPTDNIPSYRTCRNDMCIRLAGTAPSGTPICTTDADCSTPQPPITTVQTPPVQQPGTYNTCLNDACVTLSGTAPSGTPICTTDADCSTPLVPRQEPVPTTGAAGQAAALGITLTIVLLLGLRLLF